MSSEEKMESTFLWEIKNFSFCTEEKNCSISSPFFTAKSLYETVWYLSLYPRGDSDSEDGHMACCLYRYEDEGPSEIKCECELQVISAEGKILCSNKTSPHIFQQNEYFSWPSFWKKEKHLSFTYDILKLRCNLKLNSQKPLRSVSLGTTKIDIEKCSKWIMKKLNSKCSKVIKFPFNNETSQVEISVQVPEEDVKITIRRVEEITGPLSVMCRITLLDLEGKKHDSKEALHLFGDIKNESWEFPDFLKKSKLNSEKEKYLEEDRFTLKCKIAISNGTQIDLIEDKECDTSALEPSLQNTDALTVLEDYKRLYKDRILSDVKLLVDGQIIRAHKSILSVRSPVFLAMLESVTIPDLEVETVKSLLEYIYTGSVEKLDYELAAKLIVAADKYKVLALREKCAQFMKSALSHANVCEVLTVADLIKHEILKSAAVNYIKDHCEYILLSEEWNRVIENNLHLAIETMQKLSKLFADNEKSIENK